MPRGRKPDLERRAAVRRLHAEGLPTGEIAHRLGVSRQWVRQLLGPVPGGKRGHKPAVLPCGGHRPSTAEELALLGKLPDREIARRIGRTLTAVQVQRSVRRIPSVELQERLRQQAEAVSLYAAGLTMREVGARFGRHVAVVQAWLKEAGVPIRRTGSPAAARHRKHRPHRKGHR